MKTGVLWNQVVTALAQEANTRTSSSSTCSPTIAPCSSSASPKQFDVIVTDNLFGDMLSDVAAMLTGSLGMLPSASLGAPDPPTGQRKALYEPVHGSAPDIAGKGLANPIATLASFGMALRYSFDLGEVADRLDEAIAAVLDDGLRTKDIAAPGQNAVSTAEMGSAILRAMQAG